MAHDAPAADKIIFEGSLPKGRFEISRHYKNKWKLRFLRLYFDRLEYGKWNTKGRLVLRKGSPMALDHTLTVSVNPPDFGTNGNSVRHITMRVLKLDGKWQVAIFRDDPSDKRQKGTKLLEKLNLVVRVQKELHAKAGIVSSESRVSQDFVNLLSGNSLFGEHEDGSEDSLSENSEDSDAEGEEAELSSRSEDERVESGKVVPTATVNEGHGGDDSDEALGDEGLEKKTPQGSLDSEFPRLDAIESWKEGPMDTSSHIGRQGRNSGGKGSSGSPPLVPSGCEPPVEEAFLFTRPLSLAERVDRVTVSESERTRSELSRREALEISARLAQLQSVVALRKSASSGTDPLEAERGEASFSSSTNKKEELAQQTSSEKVAVSRIGNAGKLSLAEWGTSGKKKKKKKGGMKTETDAQGCSGFGGAAHEHRHDIPSPALEEASTPTGDSMSREATTTSSKMSHVPHVSKQPHSTQPPRASSPRAATPKAASATTPVQGTGRKGKATPASDKIVKGTGAGSAIGSRVSSPSKKAKSPSSTASSAATTGFSDKQKEELNPPAATSRNVTAQRGGRAFK